jgi:phosphoesterase RecJ-like protein
VIRKATAERILREIKGAKRILLALHVSPDGDSIASVLALNSVLKKWGKKTKIISFSAFNSRFSFLPGVEEIETKDFAKTDFSNFDLFIALDAAQETKITRNIFPQEFPKNFKIINIDHHITNPKFGNINLIVKSSSTCEILYSLFNLWKIKIDKHLAQLFLLGILTDTGCFQYPTMTSNSFRIVAELLDKGASLTELVLLNFRSYKFKTLKYWGKILENMQLDPSGKFVWTLVSKAEMEELGVTPAEIEGASSLFAPVTLGTEFGIIMNDEGNLIRVSLRSRADFDVSQIAVLFGGGGHKQAASFSLALPLDEAEEKVLQTVRELLKI